MKVTRLHAFCAPDYRNGRRGAGCIWPEKVPAKDTQVIRDAAGHKGHVALFHRHRERRCVDVRGVPEQS
jgi:hypothetical protein